MAGSIHHRSENMCFCADYQPGDMDGSIYRQPGDMCYCADYRD